MGRRASWSSSSAVHQALLERSLISRTGARRSRERCSSFEFDGPRDELKRIAYFHLLESFASPRVGPKPQPKLHRGRPSDFNPPPIPSVPFAGRPPWQRCPIDRVAGPRSPSDDPGCRAPTFPPAKMATCGGGGSWAVRPQSHIIIAVCMAQHFRSPRSHC